MGLNISNNIVAEVIGVIKRRTSCEVSDFDKDPMKMSFHNCILDLETTTLENHNPDFLTRIQIPWDFDPRATCPNIKRAIEDIVGKENLDLIWEIFGYFFCKRLSSQAISSICGAQG